MQDSIVITQPEPIKHKTLEERADLFQGTLNLDGEFNWDKPVGRELWE